MRFWIFATCYFRDVVKTWNLWNKCIQKYEFYSILHRNKRVRRPQREWVVDIVHREPKKRATLFLIITLALLMDFYTFCTSGNRSIKIYHFTLTVSPHYLVKLKPRINGTFWSQSSQCVHRKSSNVRIFQFFW